MKVHGMRGWQRAGRLAGVMAWLVIQLIALPGVASAQLVPQAKLTASDGTDNDYFGTAIGVSAAGNTAIIGAYQKDAVGAAYVFVRSGATWGQQTRLLPTDSGYSLLGRAVAISGDGNTALISGSTVRGTINVVYVFVRSGATWSQQQRLTQDDTSPIGALGGSLALSGDGNTALISRTSDGVQGGYIFVRSSGVWRQETMLVTTASDYAGAATIAAIGVDGNTAVISMPLEQLGANAFDPTGAVYIFTRGTGGVWGQQQRLVAGGAPQNSRFGSAIALSGDGNTLAIAAYIGSDTISYVYVRNAATWIQQTTFTNASGQPRVLSGDGNTLLAFRENQSAPYYVITIATRSGGTWSTPQQIDMPDPSYAYPGTYGATMALSADGNTAFIGSVGQCLACGRPGFEYFGPGAVFVFVPYVAPVPGTRPPVDPTSSSSPVPVPSPRTSAPAPGALSPGPTPAPLPIPRR